MFRSIAALLAAVSCVAVAQAQETPAAVAGALPYTLDQAVAAAGGSAPAAEAAQANVEAARAARTVAGLRPNPTVQTQVENIAGSGPYSGVGSAESTVSLALPAMPLIVAARTDDRPELQERGLSRLNYVRRWRSAGARSVRRKSHSMRRTRDVHRAARDRGHGGQSGNPAARISSVSSRARAGSSPPRSSCRISAGLASNWSARLFVS